MSIKDVILEKSISVVLTVIGSIATAILLWIGTTLQDLTIKMEGVMTRIEANDNTFQEFKGKLDLHDYRIDTLDKRVNKLEIKRNQQYYEIYP
jgi:hypothetical protein